MHTTDPPLLAALPRVPRREPEQQHFENQRGLEDTLEGRYAAARQTEVDGGQIGDGGGELAEGVDEESEGGEVGCEEGGVQEIYDDGSGFVQRDYTQR
jgi:hypothetical protein